MVISFHMANNHRAGKNCAHRYGHCFQDCDAVFCYNMLTSIPLHSGATSYGTGWPIITLPSIIVLIHDKLKPAMLSAICLTARLHLRASGVDDC